jgi:hypothetical protein
VTILCCCCLIDGCLKNFQEDEGCEDYHVEIFSIFALYIQGCPSDSILLSRLIAGDVDRHLLRSILRRRRQHCNVLFYDAIWCDFFICMT